MNHHDNDEEDDYELDETTEFNSRWPETGGQRIDHITKGYRETTHRVMKAMQPWAQAHGLKFK